MQVDFDYELPALNIGSGPTYIDGWVNLEKYKNSTHHNKITKEPDVWGDAHNLTFEDNYFNTIYLRHVLEHLENPIKALNECYRVLNFGGKFIIEIPDAQRVKFERPEHLFSWTEWSLKSISKFCNFSIVKYWKIGNINHAIELTKGSFKNE